MITNGLKWDFCQDIIISTSHEFPHAYRFKYVGNSLFHLTNVLQIFCSFQSDSVNAIPSKIDALECESSKNNNRWFYKGLTMELQRALNHHHHHHAQQWHWNYRHESVYSKAHAIPRTIMMDGRRSILSALLVTFPFLFTKRIMP